MVGKCSVVQAPETDGVIRYAHTAAVTAWTPIWHAVYGVLIAIVSAAINTETSFYNTGRFKFKIATGVTIAQGDLCYYTVATDDVTNVAPSAVSGTTVFVLGYAQEAGTATAGYVTIELIKGAENVIIYKEVTAAAELSRMWGTTSATSGTLRGLSARLFFTGAGTATGEAGRFYTMTTVSVTDIHGIHSTAQLGSEGATSAGTVTGQAAGVRATIGVGVTNTATITGTLASLRCDSYFLTAVTSAQSSFIYACDVGTYGVDAFIRLGTVVGRSTSASALGPYSFVTGGLTAAATAAKIALSVVTPDGTFFLLGWKQDAISAT